ncbi:MAG: hypothetical protein ABSD08_21140 [Xanthobacteraceae bacterium]
MPAWLVGRKIGLDPFWNFLFVVSLGFTDLLIQTELSGRIVGLEAHATTLLVIGCCCTSACVPCIMSPSSRSSAFPL